MAAGVGAFILPPLTPEFIQELKGKVALRQSEPFDMKWHEFKRNAVLITLWTARIATVSSLAFVLLQPLSFPLIIATFQFHQWLSPFFDQLDQKLQEEKGYSRLARRINGCINNIQHKSARTENLKKIRDLLLDMPAETLNKLWVRQNGLGLKLLRATEKARFQISRPNLPPFAAQKIRYKFSVTLGQLYPAV